MFWRIEFQVLTSWCKKDCCSFILFINGIVQLHTRKFERSRAVGWAGISDFRLCEVLVYVTWMLLMV